MIKPRINIDLIHNLVGRRVLCINDDFSNAPPLVRIIFEFPKRNTVYTIRDVYHYSFLLEEIVNPAARFPDGTEGEVSFDKPRFRILEESEQYEEYQETISSAEPLVYNA